MQRGGPRGLRRRGAGRCRTGATGAAPCRTGFAVNKELSERGLVAVGVPVRDRDGTAVAGLSVSMPATRYDAHRLQPLVSALEATARALEQDLAAQD